MMKVIDIEQRKLLEICKKNDISFIAVFGSFVKGESTDESDIDLLVRFLKRKSLLDLVRIERELSEALGRKVDLLTEASISPYLRERINSEAEVIYGKAG